MLASTPPFEHDLGLRPEWHDHNHWEEMSRVDQAGYSEGVHSRAPISDAFSPVVWCVAVWFQALQHILQSILLNSHHRQTNPVWDTGGKWSVVQKVLAGPMINWKIHQLLPPGPKMWIWPSKVGVAKLPPLAPQSHPQKSGIWGPKQLLVQETVPNWPFSSRQAAEQSAR